MKNYCKNCGAQLKDNAKFCPDCGTPAETKPKTQTVDSKNRNIIIVLIVIVALLAVGVLFASGIFSSNVPLETRDFEVFKMSVPVGAEFEEFTSSPSYAGIGGFIFLENIGDYSDNVYMLDISTLQYHSVADDFSYEITEGDIEIYKDNTGETDLKYLLRDMGEYDFGLMGEDTDTMIKMLNSIEITDENGLASQSSTIAQTSSTTSSSSTPSSISVLGGSFTTGSAEDDKTYASINVGTAHAGENVIVQIFYSRDGNSLNNGNMVPATVHSDGYLEIATADAYHYYPDYATIKIYDSNNNLLTTHSVSLSPTSGTQYF